jgi:type IV secretory pathway VirB4 component
VAVRGVAWFPGVAREVARWLTSRQVRALAPPVHDGGTGLAGPVLGHCSRGGAFVLDPFSAYRASLVANPNVLVTGAIGVGKSALVKMLLARGLAEGRRAVVLDPKGEYHELAKALGGRVVPLGARHEWCSPFSGDPREDLALVEAVLGASLGRRLSDDERFCLESTRLGETRRPVRALFEGLRGHLGDAPGTVAGGLALALRRLVAGDLAGLFDGAGDATLDGELTVLDLSAVWHEDHAPIVALAAMATARRALSSRGVPGYLVVDEAWALLSDPRVAHWLRGSWKLARATATSHVLVLHRWSDVFATADVGTAQRAQATSILRDCDTVFLFRQDPAERAVLDEVLSLREVEHRAVGALPRGTALVRYGRHRSIVQLTPTAADAAFIDTDHAMRAGT